MATFSSVTIESLFEVQSGKYHAASELDAGTVPLISCGDIDNGLVGFFDIPSKDLNERCLTVAYNGAPLLCKFHPYKFAAKDDVAVLIPKDSLSDTVLLYVASVFSGMQWRFHYGRKCFKAKLKKLTVRLPVIRGTSKIDAAYIERMFKVEWSDVAPVPGKAVPMPTLQGWKNFELTSLFQTKRGDFHSITDLAPGTYPTVSRSSTDNGVVGFFERPEEAELYERPVVTVSTVGGDSFVQLRPFIVTDNVIVCVPKKKLSVESLFFVAATLNRQKWRYGYGRQCYKKKLDKVTIPLPVNGNGELDEAFMVAAVRTATYWNALRKA